MARHALTLEPVPRIALRVEGDAAAIGHFRAEYGDAPLGSAGPAGWRLVVRFVDRVHGAAHVDRHKTVRWEATLARDGTGELELRIALRGRPRWFGLSLIQGYLVEPVLSMLAAEAGMVLVPAAGIVQDGLATLLIGHSGSGKSSVTVRALASGMAVLGDDQVCLDAAGRCLRFPRRIRVYDDLARTAPQAVAILPARQRAALRLRHLLRVVTRGYVAPSMAVPAAVFAGRQPDGPVPLGAVVLLERSSSAMELTAEDASAETAVSWSLAALTEQRRRLAATLGPAWAQDLQLTAERERATLMAALGPVPVRRIQVPGGWGAATGVSALADALGVPPP